jgi:hypothetical protein
MNKPAHDSNKNFLHRAIGHRAMKPSGNRARVYLSLLATDTCRKLHMHGRTSSKPTLNQRKQT